jgi:hypothetical protein
MPEAANQQQKKHRLQLLELLNKIESGEYEDSVLSELFSNYLGARKEYISPKDRSSYNYGYMTTTEM